MFIQAIRVVENLSVRQFNIVLIILKNGVNVGHWRPPRRSMY